MNEINLLMVLFFYIIENYFGNLLLPKGSNVKKEINNG